MFLITRNMIFLPLAWPVILLADQAAVDKWIEKETQRHNCSYSSGPKQGKVKVVCFHIGDEVIDSYNIFPVKVGELIERT